MKTLDYRISDIVMARTEDVGCILINDYEYKRLGQNISSLSNEIEAFLPEDKRKLVDDLLCIYNEQAALSEEYMYKYGFKDGIKFINICSK